MSNYGDKYDFRGDPLPRTVPQDPEAVRREQEVREAAAEALRASQVGRGPTRDGCFGPHDRSVYDPRVEGLERRIEELEAKLATLEAFVEGHFHNYQGKALVR